MSKILKNQGGSPLSITDTGITLPASPGTYVIPPQDYLLWAASSDIITAVGAATVIVNDGSTDLSVSDATDLIKGIFPKLRHIPTAGSLGALNDAVTVTGIDGLATAGIAVSGTWVGTVSFEGSEDGITYHALLAQNRISNLLATTTTANGYWVLNVSGLKSYRAKMTVYTSGAATIALQTTVGPGLARTLTTLTGATDGTHIGNVGDRLKVDSLVTIVPAPSTFGAIFRRAEVTIAAKTETDLTGVTYTVPSGKTFVLTSVNSNYDSQTPVVVRFKKQTGGSGAFATEWRLTMKQHGQDVSNVGFAVPYGVVMGAAGDVFKVTYESALAKGSLWAAFTGLEY